ncbi:MAG: cation:proton antiporter, partial [Candidatus Doudnabacteria bacterium]|nr:cation:proton antiporter [Candidatus Doudnabacteria bacterium]
MEQLSGLTELAIIIASGVVAAFVSNRIKLPSILGYLLAGIVLSLVLPRELLQSEWIGNFAQLGAALLLFAIGVEFSFENIAKVRNIVIAGSIVQAVVTLLLGLVLFPLLFGISQFHAFLIAALFSTSSTALVVKILETKGEIYTKTSNIMVGWLIMQDLMIVAWFVLFQTFAPNAQAGGDIIMAIITTAFVIGVALGVGKFVLPYIMKQVAETKSDELLIVTTVAVIVAFSVFANALGISFTIGAFLAGLSLSESFLNHEIFTEIKPLRNLFMMVFFVSIGSLFDVNAVFDQIGFIVFALIIFLVLKAAVIVIINLWFDVHIKSALKVGLGLFQVGEFAFLGAQLALHQNWIDSKLYAAI